MPRATQQQPRPDLRGGRGGRQKRGFALPQGHPLGVWGVREDVGNLASARPGRGKETLGLRRPCRRWGWRQRRGGEEGAQQGSVRKGRRAGPAGLRRAWGLRGVGRRGLQGRRASPTRLPLRLWLLRQDLHFTHFPCPLPPPRGSLFSPHPQSPPGTRCFPVWVLLPAKNQSIWELTR